MDQLKMVGLVCKKHIPINDLESGEVICSVCGIVIEERTFAEGMFDNVDMIKTTNMLGGNLVKSSTLPKYVNKDYTGQSLSSKTKQSLKHISKFDYRTADDAWFGNYVAAVDKVKGKIGFTDYEVAEVLQYIKKSQKQKLFYGHSSEYVIGALVYLVGKRRGRFRSMDYISDQLNLKIQLLKTKINSINNMFEFGFVDVRDKIFNTICNKLYFNEKIKRQFLNILFDKEFALKTQGRRSPIVIGSLIYLYFKCKKRKMSVNEISKICKCSPPGIINNVKTNESLYLEFLRKVELC